jgi:phosphomannomutase
MKKIEIKPEIFHAYDIRGIYPTEINEKIAEIIGYAFVKFLKLKKLVSKKPKIVIGYDCRLSSNNLLKAFCLGAIREKVKIINLSEVPTDLIYFALNFLKADAGVMITASHNPPYYNGIKMVVSGPRYVCKMWGMSNLKKIILNEKLKFFKEKKILKGKVIKKDLIPNYLNHILKVAKKIKILPFKNKKIKFIVDVGNGVGGKLIKLLAKKLNLKMICLFCKPDGRFPNHLPNPLILKNTKILREKVKKEKANFGLALDGDADRTIFIDEKGKVIKGDYIIALFAKYFLKIYPRSKIVYNLTCSKVVKEIIKENNGFPIRTKTGHAFMKELAKKNKAVFGGEISGHLYFKDNFYAECFCLSLLLMIKILMDEDKPLSLLIKNLTRYFKIGELNFKVKDREKVIKKLAREYKDGKIDYLDGLTVEYKNWWFNIRKSNTEPLIRLVLEADNKDLLNEKKRELIKKIKSFTYG